MSTDSHFRGQYGKGRPVEFDLAEVDWDQSGPGQNAQAQAKGLTLNRIEDGAWDPRRPETFYFTTTAGGKGATPGRDGGGLWRLTFDDIEQPRRGGTIELLLDGSEAPHLNGPDNLDIDTSGNLLIQEDPDENPHLARVVAYDIATGARGVLAGFDPDLFGADRANLITVRRRVERHHRRRAGDRGRAGSCSTPRSTSAAKTPTTSSSGSYWP